VSTPAGTTTARRRLLGLEFDPLTMTEAVARCGEAATSGQRVTIGVVNAAKAVAMHRDPGLRDAVADCDLVLADGQAVVWASRALRQPLPERVAGIDLFLGLLATAAERRLGVYFLGARPEVLADAVAEARRRFPGLVVAGHRDGYFTEEEAETVATAIRDTGADLLFLGITSPKKELFLDRWGEHTGAKVLHGVGGSFDILAGLTRRAPASWQRTGFEWLYRMLQEPRRLGPRYVTTNARFVALVLRERTRARRSRQGTGPHSEKGGR
jgi:N-acetylglucosaminyldiphosphoundecaprenol N-acetyl-beta-D-mannosaminyltransferase